ncbi:MAG: Uma2 family endonuclease [Geminicoccaceae bacterium]
MAEPARRKMTFDEFLAFEGEPDVRYEFEGGLPRAMAPASSRHGRLQENIAAKIRTHLPTGNCGIVHQPGVRVRKDADERFYVPDLAVTCEAIRDQIYLEEPRLIVEILSPGTRRNDKELKLWLYAELPSVEEIWLVESEFRWVVVWRRMEGTWVGRLPYLTDMQMVSPFLNAEIAVNDLYLGIEIG